MALLDVTEILTDPDFLTTGMTCERQAQTVGTDGMAVNTPTTFTFSGVVTSNRGDVLDRIAEGQRIVGSITIHTKFQLTDGSGSNSADIVTVLGRKYTVTSVNDYTHFGRGFVAADCEPLNLS